MNHLEERAGTFIQEHAGTDGDEISKDGIWRLFSDGTRISTVGYGALGNSIVTPSDPKEIRRWQRQFWETRLESLVEEFETLKSRTSNVVGDARFKPQLERLKELQTLVRSARSKLSHLVTQERGFVERDVERAWDCWRRFADAAEEEQQARQRYENALLKHAEAGTLEKLKAKFEEAKRHSLRAMERWNEFEPQVARGIVAEQLDAERRGQDERELDLIEI
ncbi:MAG: hypothetical protein JW993_18325 [Sedimentisphaerales bacterium]|nr:hypothetical protein [Sedimentisphaerales bacterium]